MQLKVRETHRKVPDRGEPPILIKVYWMEPDDPLYEDLSHGYMVTKAHPYKKGVNMIFKAMGNQIDYAPLKPRSVSHMVNNVSID